MGHALNTSEACDTANILALEKAGLGDGAKIIEMRRKAWNRYDLAFVVHGADGTRKDVVVTDAALKRRLASATPARKEATSIAIEGFFVDWNGDTRRVERPGLGYSCGPVGTKGQGTNAYQAVDVLDSEGFVTHEAVYYPTLDAIKAVGVVVNLVD
jgi:hypothetical protein